MSTTPETGSAKVVETETAKVVQIKLPDSARLKRRNVVLGFLAVVGLFVVLTFNFSSRKIGEAAQAAPAPALPALTAQRIEELSARLGGPPRFEGPRLDGQPARFSDEGPFVPPEERGEEGEEEDLGRFDAPTPPLARPTPGARAIEAPLVPADSGAVSSQGGSAGKAGRDSGDLAVLERLTARMQAQIPSFPTIPASFATPPTPLPSPSTQLFSSPSSSTSSSSSVARRAPVTNRLLAAGTAIPLVLAHRVVTDVPGPVVGITIRDIYDTLTSSRLLIPRGARCFGEVAGQPGFGDNRVTVAWSSCQANGVRLDFEPQGSAAFDGSAGIPAHVNQHWGQRLGTALALSFISAGVQLAQPERRDSAFGLTPGQILVGQVGTDLGRVSTEILQRGFARPPTLTLEAGSTVQLLVLKDLVIP